MNMFEAATRLKLRFETVKGILSCEELWDLPLTSAKGASLDGLARSFNKYLKEVEEESFVEKPVPDPEKISIEIRFEIVKRMIEVRIEERDKIKKAAERKERKEKLLQAIAAKQDESLQQASLEDLQKMVADLDE